MSKVFGPLRSDSTQFNGLNTVNSYLHYILETGKFCWWFSSLPFQWVPILICLVFRIDVFLWVQILIDPTNMQLHPLLQPNSEASCSDRYFGAKMATATSLQLCWGCCKCAETTVGLLQFAPTVLSVQTGRTLCQAFQPHKEHKIQWSRALTPSHLSFFPVPHFMHPRMLPLLPRTPYCHHVIDVTLPLVILQYQLAQAQGCCCLLSPLAYGIQDRHLALKHLEQRPSSCILKMKKHFHILCSVLMKSGWALFICS